MTAAIWPGRYFPLGAYFDGGGVNFSIFSEVAERIDLCLFDESGTETTLTLPERTAFMSKKNAVTMFLVVCVTMVFASLRLSMRVAVS